MQSEGRDERQTGRGWPPWPPPPGVGSWTTEAHSGAPGVAGVKAGGVGMPDPSAYIPRIYPMDNGVPGSPPVLHRACDWVLQEKGGPSPSLPTRDQPPVQVGHPRERLQAPIGSPPPSYTSLSPWSSPRTSPCSSTTSGGGGGSGYHHQPPGPGLLPTHLQRWRPQYTTLREGLPDTHPRDPVPIPRWAPQYAVPADSKSLSSGGSDHSHKTPPPLKESVLVAPRRRVGSCSSADSGRSSSLGNKGRPQSDSPPCSHAHFQRSRSVSRARGETLRVGQKTAAAIQAPGCFSHPSKVDVFPGGDIALLDTGNHTLQVFLAMGVCKKMYTFSDVLDIAVWNDDTVLLLKHTSIGIFRLRDHKVHSISLPKSAIPLAVKVLPKTTGKNNSEDAILVVMDHDLLSIQINGKVIRSIPVAVSSGNNQKDSRTPTEGKSAAAGISPPHPQQQQIRSGRVSLTSHGVLVDSANHSIVLVNAIRSTLHILAYDGKLKATIDMSSDSLLKLSPDHGSSHSWRSGSGSAGSGERPPRVSIHPSHGCCLDTMGNLVLADAGHNRVLSWIGSGYWVTLIQYSRDYLPLDVHVLPDNRLVVVLDSMGRSFAGFRIYNYDSILRDAFRRQTDPQAEFV